MYKTSRRGAGEDCGPPGECPPVDLVSVARARRAGNVELSREYRVLVAAARPVGPATPGPEQLRGMRWEVVAQLAEWHRLNPLLYHRLLRNEAVPSRILEQLERAYLENAGRNLYLRSRADMLLGALASAGVRAMPLKGAALIEDVYPDAALRPMRDIDILVPASQIHQAQQTVAALGYRAVSPVHGSEGDEAWMLQHHHHLPALVSEDGIFAVELHHHVVGPGDPARFDISGFWDRSGPAGAGRAHFLPATEDLLAHVALHFCRNRLWRSEGSLGQVADIAWIVDRRAIDWDALVARARSDGFGPSLFLALFTARELLGAAVPPSVMATLQPPSFGPGHGRRFIERRVLRDHPWLPLEYLTTNRPPLMRAFPDRAYMARLHGEGGRGVLTGQYLRRAARGVRRFGPSLARPWAAVSDLRLNRWMRSMEHRA